APRTRIGTSRDPTPPTARKRVSAVPCNGGACPRKSYKGPPRYIDRKPRIAAARKDRPPLAVAAHRAYPIIGSSRRKLLPPGGEQLDHAVGADDFPIAHPGFIRLTGAPACGCRIKSHVGRVEAGGRFEGQRIRLLALAAPCRRPRTQEQRQRVAPG